MKRQLSVFILALLCAGVFAQESFPSASGNFLVNRLRVQQMVQQNVDEQIVEEIGGARQKSIGKAVLFSAVLPGAGQFYSESYLKAALFLGVEVAAWTLNISYNKKGDNQDASFRSFADSNWREQAYWSYVYYRVNGMEGVTVPDFALDSSDPNKPLIIDWQAAIQYLEPYTNSQYIPGFTHHLPDTRTQQYYEMIGKYPEQFGNAWADADFNTVYNGYENRLSPMNRQYAGMRDQANDYYKIAGYGSMIALLNHVISAIDAGFTARRFNGVQAKLTYRRKKIDGEPVNMFGVKVSW